MSFVAGFAIWIALALVGGAIAWAVFAAPGNAKALNYIFGLLGAFIGGMLGTSPYIWHDPSPLRAGAIIGALIGSLLFPWTYHIAAKKFL